MAAELCLDSIRWTGVHHCHNIIKLGTATVSKAWSCSECYLFKMFQESYTQHLALSFTFYLVPSNWKWFGRVRLCCL